MSLSKLFDADLQSISAFRILLGCVLLGDFVLNLLPIIPDFYYDSGFLPRQMVMLSETRTGYISLLMMSGHKWVVNGFLAVYGVAVICFIIGYRTTLAKWLVFIGYLSLIYRAPMLDSGAEMLMRLFLLWSLFVPMHRYWSVDAALSRVPRNEKVPPIFIAAIKLQITWLYLFSGIYKLFGNTWREGTAIAGALSDGIYSSPFGAYFAELVPILLTPLTYGVIVFQLIFSALVYSPVFNNTLRALAICGALAMHGAFLFLLEVGMFPFLCAVYLILLVPEHWWNALLSKRRARLEKIVVYFDPGCGFCEKVSKILREFCLSPSTRVLPASDHAEAMQLLTTHNSWVVMDEETQKTYMKWEAVAFVLKQTPLFWPLGALYNLPFLKSPFTALYDCVGRNRSSLGKITAECLPWDDKPYKPSFFAKAICALLILIALTSNIVYLPSFVNQPYITRDLKNFITLSQAYQRWNLFAPNPVSASYDYELEGVTRAKTNVDLRPFFEKGRIWLADKNRLAFQSHRWIKFFTRFYEPQNKRILRYALIKIAARYNRGKPSEERLESIKITLRQMRNKDVKPNEPLKIVREEEVDLSLAASAASLKGEEPTKGEDP